MLPDNPVEQSETVATDLAPALADAYDIDLETPDFKGTRAGYTSIGTAMEYISPPEQNDDRTSAGTVKVREDMTWTQTALAPTVGHELGHAALYQNSDFQNMREDDTYDDQVLRSISEGVAQHFERTSYRSLGKNALERLDIPDAALYTFRYTVKRGGQRLWDATIARKYPDAYADGRDLMTGMSRDEINDIINNPDQFYQQIVDQV